VVELLRAAISCGTLTEAGQQRVDGIEATRLTSGPGSRISETIWVDPATYLPVRVVIRSAADSPVTQRTADITWLKPTAQNQAALTVSIPAGFRQVPFGPSVNVLPNP
jgi:outer membrane lipoprotein-sorting protein